MEESKKLLAQEPHRIPLIIKETPPEVWEIQMTAAINKLPERVRPRVDRVQREYQIQNIDALLVEFTKIANKVSILPRFAREVVTYLSMELYEPLSIKNQYPPERTPEEIEAQDKNEQGLKDLADYTEQGQGDKIVGIDLTGFPEPIKKTVRKVSKKALDLEVTEKPKRVTRKKKESTDELN